VVGIHIFLILFLFNKCEKIQSKPPGKAIDLLLAILMAKQQWLNRCYKLPDTDNTDFFHNQ